jgi:hypothetical protein
MVRILRGIAPRFSQQMAAAAIACGVAAATPLHADPYNNIVIVPPTNLPELARQTGEALLLRETSDGRQLLYIEQNQGSQLSTFDVTDPTHVKGAGSVKLDASEPFDFLSPIGKRSELIRFRNNRKEAVVNFQKDDVPDINVAQGLTFAAQNTAVDADGFVEVTNVHTGTTFFLTPGGLYLIRHPEVEVDKKRRDQEWFEQHTGG